MSPILALRHALCAALAEIDEPISRAQIPAMICDCDMILYPFEEKCA